MWVRLEIFENSKNWMSSGHGQSVRSCKFKRHIDAIWDASRCHMIMTEP